MKKVYIWQGGFTSRNDRKERINPECRAKGYILLPEDLKDWEWKEYVWEQLNWGCWADKKPDNVFSPLDHCNSDIIIHEEGTSEYYRAASVDWVTYYSLEGAIQDLLKNTEELWMFPECRESK